MAMMTENNQLNDSTNGSSTMYEDEADPIADYRQSLADLVMNSKPHILMLTMLAEDYKDSKAAEIVDCIEQRLFQVSTDKKLPTLYLIDSICKNMAVSSYVELFQAKIIKMFCHTFERSDEKVRLLLYKLRQTWNDIFAANVLYNLDLNVKKIDKAWPITNKPENGQSAQVKPGTNNTDARSKLSNVASSFMCKPNTKAAEITAQLLSKQNESLALHRQQIEMDLRKKIIMNAQKSGQLPLDHCEPIVNPVQNQSQRPQQPKALKETKRKTSISSSSQEQPPIKKGKKESSIKNNNSNKVNKNQSKKLKPITSLTPISPLTKNKKLGSGCGPANNNKRKAPSASPKIPKKASVLDTLPLNLPIAPDDVIPLGQSHRTAGPKWSKQDKFHRSTESSDSAKSRRSPFRHRSPSQSSAPQSSGTRNRSSPTKSFKNDSSSSVSNTINNKKLSTSSTIQTTIPEPNIFAQPEALYSFSSLDNNAGPKSTDSNWNHSSPAQQPAAASSFAMDRDYRHEFDTFVSEAKNKLNTGAISSADHELLVREAERHLFEMQANAPSPFGANSPFGTSVVPTHQSHVPAPLPPTSQQPLPAAVDRPVLVEPHGSIVLFINNELRRLYYVDTVTSIVLLKVHPDTIFDQLVSCDPALLEPKQVFFSGMTTTVYIDHGQPTEQSINLEFNSSVPCTFYLPGSSVPQQIMLGLPARELVINGRAHQAAFGGASVSIYFDCDRKYHTFQLSDSRPLLKFSGEFRCDLWLKLVNDARLKAGLPAMAPPPQQQQPHFSNYPPSAGPIPQVTHPYSSAVPNNNPYPMSQQQHPLPYNQPPFSEVPQPHASIQPTTNLSYNIPAPSTSFDNSASTPNKFPDLNSLLSKLTAVGLIGNKGASTSIKSEPDNQKTEPEPVVIPKQYLPLEVSALKNSHQFVVDQLYSGVQCTNCSLRFSDATSKDGKGTKSRYSRHLDWHFRQNRRDKAKPGSNATGSSTVAHRRPWYYAIDLWILFKEVNDDIEEDSSEFFDSNSANSPGGTSTTVNNFDFSRFKDCISDFETFIEVISCDNNGLESAACGRNNSDQQQLKKKVCSVVAESDAKLNSCTVCSEKFDLEWHEEEEEWRFQNAIRYTEGADEEDDTHPPTSRIFHPLCLKDHIIQQEKSAIADASQLSIDANTTIDSSQSIPALDSSDIKKEEPTEEEPKRKTESKKDNFVIPGFDSYIKEEEMETDEKLNDDAKKMDDEILNALKQEIMDEDANDQDDAGDHSMAEESLVDEKPEEDLEIKVFEIEIPIDGSASAGLVIKDEAAAESSVDSSLSPVRHSDTGVDQPSNNKPKQPIQPKRGGIVIKMKKPQPQPEPEEEPSETSEPVVQYTTEPGNVLDDVMMNECDDDHANANDDAHIEMMKLNDINDANDTNDNVNHDQTTAVIGHRPVDREGNTDDENLIEPHTTTDHLHQISSSIDNNSDNADSCIVDSNVTDSDNKGNNQHKDLSEVNDDVEQDASSVDDIRSSSASVDIVVAAAGEQAEYSAPCKNEAAEEVVAKSQSTSGCVIDRDDSVGHSDHSNCGDSRSRTIPPLSPSSSDQQSAISVIVNGVCGGGRSSSGAGGGFSDDYSDDSDDGFGNRPATTKSSDPSDYEKSGESPGGSSSHSSSGSVLSPKTPAATSDSVPDSADCKSSSEVDEDQPPECNYYSRGHELSSLCTIM